MQQRIPNFMSSPELSYSEKVSQATSFVRQQTDSVPRVAIILGTGLGKLATHITPELTLPYAEIPHFPQSTALSHQGQLVVGTLEEITVVAMQGRFHLYEGYPLADAVLPVHVMQSLGADILVVSNASGGVNPKYAGGDIMVMSSHINLMFRQHHQLSNASLIAPALEQPGTLLYDQDLIELALQTGRDQDFAIHEGCYVSLTGPNYETRSEYRMVRKIGGDVVGMSTVPEVLTAHSLNMRVLALSAVTNVAKPNVLTETTAEEVIDIARLAEPKLTAIVTNLLRTL